MNAVRYAQITHQVHLMLGGLTGILSTLTPDEKTFALELINQWRIQQGGQSQQVFAPAAVQQTFVQQEVAVQKPAAVPASKPSAPKTVQKKETSKPGTWVAKAKTAVKPKKQPVEEPASPPAEETDTNVSRWGDSPKPDDEEENSDSDNRSSPVPLATIQQKQREEEDAEEARINITGFCSKGKACGCVYTFRDISTKEGKLRDPARFDKKLILETTVFGNVSFNNGEERASNAEFAKELQSLLSTDPRIKLTATGKPIEVRLDKGAMGFFFVNLATHTDAKRAIERISQLGTYDEEDKYHSSPAERALGFGVCNVGFATQNKKGKKE
jgi:hypothetical protein